MVDEPPDYLNRSALAIHPGQWRMRNGHTAEITRRGHLEYTVDGKKKQFAIWYGKCAECNEHKTWNINGTYAGVGKHGYDILEPIDG